eukprot:scaffold1154_cov310-Pinguiococcus_pyrenoidosus.AAC.48
MEVEGESLVLQLHELHEVEKMLHHIRWQPLRLQRDLDGLQDPGHDILVELVDRRALRTQILPEADEGRIEELHRERLVDSGQSAAREEHGTGRLPEQLDGHPPHPLEPITFYASATCLEGCRNCAHVLLAGRVLRALQGSWLRFQEVVLADLRFLPRQPVVQQVHQLPLKDAIGRYARALARDLPLARHHKLEEPLSQSAYHAGQAQQDHIIEGIGPQSVRANCPHAICRASWWSESPYRRGRLRPRCSPASLSRILLHFGVGENPQEDLNDLRGILLKDAVVFVASPRTGGDVHKNLQCPHPGPSVLVWMLDDVNQARDDESLQVAHSIFEDGDDSQNGQDM